MSDKTALYEAAAGAGAVFGNESGWALSVDYGNPDAEYAAARSDSVFFDLSHWCTAEVSGPDAAVFLHNLSTNDVKRLAPGSGCEAFFTTGQGKVIGHAFINCVRPDSGDVVYSLLSAPGTGARLLAHLNHYLVTEQVELADQTAKRALIHVAGPQAARRLQTTLKDRLKDLGPLEHMPLTIGDICTRLQRFEPLGLAGYNLTCAPEHAARLWQMLRGAGFEPAGTAIFNLLRIEAGTPLYGIDMDEGNLPQEVGRTDQTVSFTKGCYIGQETIARIRTYGHVNRTLVGLMAGNERAIPSGSRLLRDGKEIGHVTSSVHSPRLGSTIALGYTRRGSQDPGTLVEIEGIGGALVVSLPFGSPEPQNKT